MHAVLSGSAPARIRAATFTEVVVTDTIPVPPEKRDPKLTVLPTAKLLAEAIARVHDGRSISELFS